MMIYNDILYRKFPFLVSKTPPIPEADRSPRPTQKRPPPANPTLPPPAPRAPPRACSKAVGEMKARAADA